MLNAAAVSGDLAPLDNEFHAGALQSVKRDLADVVMWHAMNVVLAQIEALHALAGWIDQHGHGPFPAAVHLLSRASGRVIVTGMGKSGHIGRKVAASMASLGTPASFVHPAEGSHGDLGMVTRSDALLAFSNSGNTPELADILMHARDLRIPIVAVTAGAASFLSAKADVTILVPKTAEGCALGLAPTSSTAAQLAAGDALAVALSAHRDFRREDFRRLHPGGTLGLVNARVDQVMLTESALPLVRHGVKAADILFEMARKSFDVAGVVDDHGRWCGSVSVQNLRHDPERTAMQMLDRHCLTLERDMTVADAQQALMSRGLNAAFVIEDGKPVGIVRRSAPGR
jgi:arabinose-5-phosphate isomerase